MKAECFIDNDSLVVPLRALQPNSLIVGLYHRLRHTEEHRAIVRTLVLALGMRESYPAAPDKS